MQLHRFFRQRWVACAVALSTFLVATPAQAPVALIPVVYAIAYAVVSTVGPITGAILLQAVLVGLFGGWMSQNVNTMVRRATSTPQE